MNRYVIVVHGIGEQRPNETVLAVVNRFAEARSEISPGQPQWPPGDVLTLGLASGQSGPWLEFEHIPRAWTPPATRPFLAEAAHGGGNLRFVDLYWADLLGDDFKDVGEKPEAWTASVLGRLNRKGVHDGQAPPAWARELLRLMRDTIVLVRKVLAIRGWKDFDDLVFNKFLGDVQLYGEYAKVRGRAVRRFHDRISQIEDVDPGARYTIIAHSLGTVMSMDALLFAHADLELRAGLADPARQEVANLPFPGYLDDPPYAQGSGEIIRAMTGGKAPSKAVRKPKGASRGARMAHAMVGPLKKDGTGIGISASDAAKIGFLDTSWLERVDALVTLGSPIDKFLVIWWFNYKYLATDGWIHDERPRIKHYNYCDEQDPVGHKLDIAASAPAFARVFETVEDQVFNRYAVPGAAHVAYWKDLPLFRWILARAVDQREGVSDLRPKWFDEAIYRQVLAYTYKIVPLTVILLDFGAFTWAWYSGSWHARALATALFVVICLIGRHLIDLCVWWRRVLIAKDQAMKSERPTFRAAIADAGTACMQFVPARLRAVAKTESSSSSETDAAESDHRHAERQRQGRAFRGRLLITQVSALVLAGSSAGLFFAIHGKTSVRSLGESAFMVAVALLTVVVWLRLFRTRDVAWPSTDAECHAVEHPHGENLSTTAFRTYSPVVVAIVAGAIGVRYLAAVRPVSELAALVASRLQEWSMFERLPDITFIVASFLVMAAVVFTYLRLRFKLVQGAHAGVDAGVDFREYVGSDP